jgi:hypothetical protein
MAKNELVKNDNSEILQKLILTGDLSKMSEDQKVMYYKQFCESLGLNPLTEPFALLNLNGKQKLYARKEAAEQLRKVHGISIIELTTEEGNGVYRVIAKAKDKDGKTDVSTGVVSIEGLKGEALSNAMMKAETKAKRRVTLSISGLGMLDETEVETIKEATVTSITTAPAKKSITPAQFSKLLTRIEAEGADVDALLKQTMDNFILDDNQAELLASTVAKAQTPAA